LAFLVSKFLHEIPNSELQNKLYFLWFLLDLFF
jgi:hypothetical protein